jgi:hypothetical protein
MLRVFHWFRYLSNASLATLAPKVLLLMTSLSLDVLDRKQQLLDTAAARKPTSISAPALS